MHLRKSGRLLPGVSPSEVFLWAECGYGVSKGARTSLIPHLASLFTTGAPQGCLAHQHLMQMVSYF